MNKRQDEKLKRKRNRQEVFLDCGKRKEGKGPRGRRDEGSNVMIHDRVDPTHD